MARVIEFVLLRDIFLQNLHLHIRAQKSQRNRNIMVQPPYNKNVKTNISKIFIKIIDKCFRIKQSELNRNTLKI